MIWRELHDQQDWPRKLCIFCIFTGRTAPIKWCMAKMHLKFTQNDRKIHQTHKTGLATCTTTVNVIVAGLLLPAARVWPGACRAAGPHPRQPLLHHRHRLRHRPLPRLLLVETGLCPRRCRSSLLQSRQYLSSPLSTMFCTATIIACKCLSSNSELAKNVHLPYWREYQVCHDFSWEVF